MAGITFPKIEDPQTFMIALMVCVVCQQADVMREIMREHEPGTDEDETFARIVAEHVVDGLGRTKMESIKDYHRMRDALVASVIAHLTMPAPPEPRLKLVK